MKTKLKIFILSSIIFITGCAGPNPNPGERTIDMGIMGNSLTEYDLENLRNKAEKGFPWAQLRMGVIHEKGNGVIKNLDKAERWYTLTAENYGDDAWSNGHMIGAIGKAGYFNQNSDALIAKFQLAGIYLDKNSGKLNISKGYELIKEVKEKSNNTYIFYCCEFAGGRYITVGMINEMMQKAETLKGN